MVSTTFKKIVYPCWKPSSVEGDCENGGNGAGSGGIVDGLWWYKDYGKHVNGEFSVAVIEANSVIEDQCQVESGSLSADGCGVRGTFVGIYDGHAGPEAARFVNDRLFHNVKKFTSENQGMSADIIRRAFLATEEEFLSLVENEWETNPRIASVGSCCLVGIICNGVLYIANAGDSRAVLAREEKTMNAIKAVKVSEEHNAKFVSVREELRASHPNDENIVVLKHNVWRVRGLIQRFRIPQLVRDKGLFKISRSIGDSYLKKAEFNRPPLLPKFRQAESFDHPILKAEPAILVQKITPEDQFLILASDGLWDHLSDQEAVDIVKSSPRDGIARRLVKAALEVAANKRELRYSDLKKVDRGVRRHFHDDITVIVLFLNCHSPKAQSSSSWPTLTVKSPTSL